MAGLTIGKFAAAEGVGVETVRFYRWCPPCRMVAPVLEEIAREHAGQIDVVKLNTDENPATMQRYGVMAVPTMHALSGGQVVRQVVGARSKSALLRDFADLI